MGVLDDIVTPVTGESNGSSGTLTFGSAPASGDLIVLMYATHQQEITGGPSGFTELDSGFYNGQTRSKVYAKVAGSSEGTSYAATFSGTTNWSGIARRIEGPFTDLSTLTCSGETTSYSTTQRILSTNVAVAANTKVIAMLATNEATDAFSSATNSFGTLVEVVEGAARCIQVDRTYTTSATDVHTQLTLTNPGFGRRTLLRIAEPGSSGPSFRPWFAL